ncbi:MAG: thioesterase superfamily protein [Frankiales bacterium]|nr:thioesterase superfamily protein [Frankiales bacterium]
MQPLVEMQTTYGDLDSAGHVGAVAQSRYIEHARYRWHQKLDLPALTEGRGVLFVARLTIDCLAPVHVGPPVQLGVRVLRFGTSSVTEELAIWQEGTCVSLAEGVMVYSEQGRPTPLTARLRAGFEQGVVPAADAG